MILNLLVIGAVLLIAYIWASRGFLSAFLHLLCTIVAGAIAFALWEPLAYGVFLGVRDDIAWSVSLVLPFVVSLALLRYLVDKLIKNNVGLHDATNLVGGAICGGAAGLIAVGIFVISIGFLRLPPDFLGHRPATFAESTDGPGVLIRGASLWVPADTVVETFYGLTSQGALATDTPLALRAPDLAVQGNLQRYNFMGQGRTSLTPADFTVLGQYVVEGANLDALLTDSFTTGTDGNPVTQKVIDIDGKPFPDNSRLVGAVVLFKAGAKEQQGQVVVGPGQVRLLATNATTGDVKTILPAAFINQGDPLALDYKRWRFDSDGVFAASVGGAADSTMAFEFVVPPDYTASELQVRNVRVDLASIPENKRPSGNPSLAFESVQARDGALRDFSLLTEMGVNIQGAELTQDENTTEVLLDQGQNSIVIVSERLPFNGQFNRSKRGQLDITDDNQIIAGEEKFLKSEYSEIGLQENLRVYQLGRTSDTRIVQVDAGLQSRLSLLGRAFQKAESVVPPVLVDSLGRQYQPVGYVFANGNDVTVRYTPGNPIQGLAQIPSLSTAREDQELRLLFRVNAGAELTKFAIGGRVVATFNPTVTVGR
jgi:hypothetical protein